MGDVILDLKIAVIEMNHSVTAGLTRDALENGISAADILNNGLIPGLDEVGVRFRDGDYFLPDVLMCVKAYDASYQVLEPHLKQGEYESRGKVMLGTVAGDIHEIGKNILAALLQGNGFDVINLGADVKADTFLEKARELEPDIIGMSALLTTTMPEMKEVIDLFGKEGIRDRYRFIIGGSPLSQSFAQEIGADGYGEDAQDGVELVKSLMG